MEVTLPKIKSVTSFKSKTLHGDLCKIYVTIYETNICLIHKLIWTSRHIPFDLVTNRFGKGLYIQVISFYAESIEAINYIVNGKAN